MLKYNCVKVELGIGIIFVSCDNYVCLCEKCHMNFRLPVNRLLVVCFALAN
jgi:hypothetical protein